MTELVNTAEQISIVTLAFSGAAAGIKQRKDVFNLMVLGFIAASEVGLFVMFR